MYKLLMRAFPGWYRGNSVYALYPFTTPEGTREILEQHGSPGDFDFKKPAYIPRPAAIGTWQGVTNVLENQQQFRVPCKTLLAFRFKLLPPDSRVFGGFGTQHC
jgi:hypothetical protein